MRRRVTQVRLGTVIPAGTIWNNILKEQASEWGRLTGGRVRLTVMAGTQGDEDAIIRKMRTSGQSQAASLSAVSLAMSIDQSFNVFFIPMFFQDYAELDHVMAKLEPVITQRLADKGFVFINWGSGGWVQVFSKKPAKNLRDLKGMKLFTSAGDDVTVQWYKDNGFPARAAVVGRHVVVADDGMIEAVPVDATLGAFVPVVQVHAVHARRRHLAARRGDDRQQEDVGGDQRGRTARS